MTVPQDQKFGLRRYAKDTLLGHSIPVWMTLVLMILGAIATYMLAPMINSQFEIQAARREFLVGNLNSLAEDTKSLIDGVSSAIQADSSAQLQQAVGVINPLISKLQFSSVQLQYVIPNHAKEILEFQGSLEKIQISITDIGNQQNQTPLIEHTKQLSRQSLELYDLLLKEAGLGT